MLDLGRTWRDATTLVWLVVAAAAGALLWAVPATVRFAFDAPSLFWAMALAAIVVDAPLFWTSRRDDPRVPSTLSICFTFTIFVLWGAAPAIVTQIAAVAVSVIGRRHRLSVGAFLAARNACAAIAAELMVTATQLRPFNARGTGVEWREVADALAAAGIWLMVSYGILAVAGAHRGGLRRAISNARPDLVRTATAVLLVSPLLTVLTDWWPLLVALPVLAWSGLLRDQLRERDRLSREPVTGLLNRRGLTVGMRALIAGDATAADEPRPFAVIVINVDPVLTITNTFGRGLSERVIGEASRRLVEAYGEDRVGQLSGENFVLLIPDVDEDDAMAETERAVGLLTPPIEVDNIPFQLDPVGGVAMSPQHGREIGTLLMKSGLAASGGRRYGHRAVLYVRQAAAIARRQVSLLSQLNLALQDPARHDEIAVCYQPQVDVATGHLVGVEALLRWTHPQLGPVPTNEVIQAVESSQVMRMLTRHVIQTVAAQLHYWNRHGRLMRAAVNVSVQDLHDPEFVPGLDTVLTSLDIQPRQLVIEITERMPITHPRTARAADALKELGVGLSLDDFGTGHASLQQLRQLPLTEVKIDRSYVSKIVGDHADLAIVTSVHQLASALGVVVVAEGIEDRATALALARFDGTIGQGYYFGRPMSAQALEMWIMQSPAECALAGAGNRVTTDRRLGRHGSMGRPAAAAM